MEVYAFIGPSGTGKSHRASYLAQQLEIPLIVDDGLLIAGTAILAGKSAKREATRFGAVKRAIFHHEKHAAEVRSQIATSGAKSILLLGTSEKMVKKIAERLHLPPPGRVIRIEEVASASAIKQALEARNKENSHVIPLPTFAIKKDFPGYLLAALRSFFWKSHREEPKKMVIERSVVRPIYSSLGNYYLAENVITDIIAHLTSQVPGVSHTGRAEVTTRPGGSVTLQIEVNVIYGYRVPDVLVSVQRLLKEQTEYLTGLTVESIQVTARRIDLG